MSMFHSDAQQLKFRLFADGLTLSPAAHKALIDFADGQQLSSNDYASTSGIILLLDNNVWVNAPIVQFNPNFVADSPNILDHTAGGFVVRGDGLESSAKYWLQPSFHGKAHGGLRPLTDYVVTHGDRARLSPLHGCGMACTFCDVPYGMKYAKKTIDTMVEAVGVALSDSRQPARHLLISGGTPRASDVGWLKDVYRSILTTFPATEVDIMMVPVDDLLDVDELGRLGVHQLSINLELFSDSAARRYMPQKYRQGQQYYLDFIENAAGRLGVGSVRSMLMVGLEPVEDTLRGVRAIVERGGVPVLSPFRPDPSTPLRKMAPPDFEALAHVFFEAGEIASKAGIALGPSCVPCSHNTLTLPDWSGEDHHHPVMRLV